MVRAAGLTGVELRMCGSMGCWESEISRCVVQRQDADHGGLGGARRLHPKWCWIGQSGPPWFGAGGAGSAPSLASGFEGGGERKKLVLDEQRANMGVPKHSFEELFERAILFLGSPAKLWKLGTFQQKRLVLRLTFSDRISYGPKQGLRIPKLSFPFKMFATILESEKQMARHGR